MTVKQYEERLEYVKLAKRANQRIRRLEKAQYTPYAYNRVMESLRGRGKMRFSETWKMYDSEEDFQSAMSTLRQFLKAKESKVGYVAEKQRNFAANAAKAMGINVEGREDDWYDFLSSQRYRELSRYMDSSQIIEETDAMFNEGKSAAEVNDAWDAWKAGETINVGDYFGKGSSLQ